MIGPSDLNSWMETEIKIQKIQHISLSAQSPQKWFSKTDRYIHHMTKNICKTVVWIQRFDNHKNTCKESWNKMSFKFWNLLKRISYVEFIWKSFRPTQNHIKWNTQERIPFNCRCSMTLKFDNKKSLENFGQWYRLIKMLTNTWITTRN